MLKHLNIKKYYDDIDNNNYNKNKNKSHLDITDVHQGNIMISRFCINQM